MLIIVGLGNPGELYENTNHNIGFNVVDLVCQKFGKSFKLKTCDSLVAELNFNGEKIVLAKPHTFMNLSGIAVKQLVKKYKALPESELVVVCDDYDTPSGKIRIREITNSTTHNGIKNIIEELGSLNFIKIKVSIGKKPFKEMPTADFVLSKIKDENTFVARDRAVDAVVKYIETRNIGKVMQEFNG